MLAVVSEVIEVAAETVAAAATAEAWAAQDGLLGKNRHTQYTLQNLLSGIPNES